MADLNMAVSPEVLFGADLPPELVPFLDGIKFDFRASTEEELRALLEALGGRDRFRFNPGSSLITTRDRRLAVTRDGEPVCRVEVNVWWEPESQPRPVEVVYPFLEQLRQEQEAAKRGAVEAVDAG